MKLGKDICVRRGLDIYHAGVDAISSEINASTINTRTAPFRHICNGHLEK